LGYNIRTEQKSITSLVGVCHQKELLFPMLTADQQVRLYLALRRESISGSIKEFVDLTLKQVGLDDVARQNVSTFSGGMKRRLGIALSIIGKNCKVLLLDEPTTGLDPISRQKVWRVIQTLKKDRIIVLATRCMV
jgi:ABC-type multidrug transport system ATPase subunit